MNPEKLVNLLGSFKIFSFLMLGRHMCHEDHVKPAVLVTAWSWSVFLDSIDSVDPSDVPLGALRVLHGVASRRGLRRAQITDGPRIPSMLTASQLFRYVRICTYLEPGVSTTERSLILFGHHSDTFHVTQKFTWHHLGTGIQTYGFGFRQMIQWSVRSRRLPCRCEKLLYKTSTSHTEHITSSAHSEGYCSTLSAKGPRIPPLLSCFHSFSSFYNTFIVFATPLALNSTLYHYLRLLFTL